jgi:hypothetical protein
MNRFVPRLLLATAGCAGMLQLALLQTAMADDRGGSPDAGRWVRGHVVSMSETPRVLTLAIVDGAKSSLRRVPVADDAAISVNGAQAAAKNLEAGQIADVRSIGAGEQEIADAVVAQPYRPGGGNENSRRLVEALTLARGGAGGNQDGFDGNRLLSRAANAGNGLSRFDSPADGFLALSDRLDSLADVAVSKLTGPKDELFLAQLDLVAKLRAAASVAASVADAGDATLQASLEATVRAMVAVEESCDKVFRLADKVDAKLHAVAGLVADSLRHTTDVLKELVETTGDAASELKARVSAAVGATVDIVEHVTAALEGDVHSLLAAKLRRAADKIEYVAGEAKGELSDAARRLTEKLHRAADAARALKGEAGEKLADGKRLLVKALREAADACRAVERLVGKVDHVKGSLVHALHETADCFVGHVEPTVEAAKSRIFMAAHRVEHAAENLIGDVKEKAGDLHGVLAHKLRHVAFTIERVADGTKDKLYDARHELARKLRIVAHAVEGLRDKTGDKLRDARTLVAEALRDALEACGKMDRLLEKAGGIKQGLIAALQETAACLVGDKIEDLKATIGDTKSDLRRAVHHVQDGAAELVQKVGTIADITPLNAGVDGYLDADADLLGIVDFYVWVDSYTAADVILQGNIHEALARPVAWTNQIVVVRNTIAPPENLKEEIDVNVVGNGLVWINGYWTYSSIDEDFQWTGGILRRPPPGHHWVPGKWVRVKDGFARIPGAWIPDKLNAPQKIEKLPASFNFAPIGKRPSVDHFWAPGSFVSRNGSLVQNPGRWVRTPDKAADWIWTPPQVIPTADGGGLLIDGFWDYPITKRGFVFAPVQFGRGADPVPASKLASAVVLDLPRTFHHLFVDERTGHYVFGDFYDADPVTSGIRPWFEFSRIPGRFDPLFEHYSRLYDLAGADFASRLNGWHRYFKANPFARPAQSLAALIRRLVEGAPAGTFLPAFIDPSAAAGLKQAGIDPANIAALNRIVGSRSITLADFTNTYGNGPLADASLGGGANRVEVVGKTLGGTTGGMGQLSGGITGTDPFSGFGTGANLSRLYGVERFGATVGGDALGAFGNHTYGNGTLGGVAGRLHGHGGGMIGSIGGATGGLGGICGASGIGGAGGVGNGSLGGFGGLGAPGAASGAGSTGVLGGSTLGGVGGTVGNTVGGIK